MKYCKSRHLLIVATAWLINSAYAVDGYQDLKFGMSKYDVASATPCDIKPNKSTAYITTQTCDKFQFGSLQTSVDFIFINEGLEVLVLYVGADKFTDLVASLRKKYGVPTSRSSKNELESVGVTPNSSAYFSFANNAVRLVIASDQAGKQDAALYYISDNYIDKKRRLKLKTSKTIFSGALNN